MMQINIYCTCKVNKQDELLRFKVIFHFDTFLDIFIVYLLSAKFSCKGLGVDVLYLYHQHD